MTCKQDTNILVIYIEDYHFEHFYKWWKTRPGKILMKILSKKRYEMHLKGVYFDSNICFNEEIDTSVRETVLECVTNLTYDLHEFENIKCFTVCSSCNRLCTIKFHFDHLPECQTWVKNCKQC